jgi:hypothetical protein
MKFQWYVIDLTENTIEGSNDVDEIRGPLKDENFLVLTAQHGKFYHGSTDEQEVTPFVQG